MPRINPAIAALDKRLAGLNDRLKVIEGEHASVEEAITTLRAARDEAAAAVRKRSKKPAECKPACKCEASPPSGS